MKLWKILSTFLSFLTLLLSDYTVESSNDHVNKKGIMQCAAYNEAKVCKNFDNRDACINSNTSICGWCTPTGNCIVENNCKISSITKKWIKNIFVHDAEKCISYTTYDDCIAHCDSDCGWCISESKFTCTIKKNCLKSSTSSWIQFDVRKIFSANSTEPRNFPLGILKDIQLQLITDEPIDNHTLFNNKILCKFSIKNSSFSAVTNGSIQLTSGNNHNLSCAAPKLNEMPALSCGSHSSTVELSIKLGNANIPDIWNTTIVFFDCSSYNSQTECVSSVFPCHWLERGEKCVHLYNASEHHRGEQHENSSLPSISSFSPQYGVWTGNTNVTIEGENLGDKIEDIREAITVAGIPCIPFKFEDEYVQKKIVVCTTIQSESTPSTVQKGPVGIRVHGILATSNDNFTFVVPNITGIHPREGPTYGGTELTITGEHLTAGKIIRVSINNISCTVFYRISSNVKCITGSTPNAKTTESKVLVEFDGIFKFANDTFNYREDKERDEFGFNKEPKGIHAGGVTILMRHENLPSSTKTLHFQVHFNNKIYYSRCKIRKNPPTTWECLSPNIPEIDENAINATNPKELEFSVMNDKNISILNHSRYFRLYPNPKFDYFFNSSVEFNDSNYLIIKGQHINDACQKTDINVQIGNNTCDVFAISKSQITCVLQKSQRDVLKHHENITVSIGSQFNMTVLKQTCSSQKQSSNSNTHNTAVWIMVAMIVASAFFLFAIFHFFHHRRIRAKGTQITTELQQQVNKMSIETISMRQCIKQIIIENQINLDENLSKLLKLPNVTIDYMSMSIQCDTTAASSNIEYIVPIDDKWEFPRNNLSLGKCLGEGEFGKVVQAEAFGILQENIPTAVAVKMLKDVHSDSDMIDLVSEMELMKLVGEHPNIIKLLGCCTQGGNLLVIMEYASHGNLRDFLRKHFLLMSEEKPLIDLSAKTLLMFGLQVARGMEYLASIQCIHRDLAARNVLVFHDYIMKIGDFGLARDVQSKDYYRKNSDGKVPIKWMAPESIGHGHHSTKSDVWSYGVLLWEIMTFGGTPYPSFPDLARLFKALCEGYRMEKPSNCSVKTYSLMHKCWSYMAEDRPSFTMIINSLEDILASEAHDETLKRCKVYWPERNKCNRNYTESQIEFESR